MGKLVVVSGDAVKGKDTHNVSGIGPNPGAPPPTATFVGTGSYDYVGSMTDSLSTFVKIGGKSVAMVSAKSSLNQGESAPPLGRHSGPKGSNYKPDQASIAQLPTPLGPPLLKITDNIGTGVPNASAGSAVLTIGGVKVLLDGDSIDTCDGLNATGNSTVTASGQSFVNCSG
jgi:uncharacterized Zn-binding protein involved in type VI secretion